MTALQTGFSDVCGAMDELKRLAVEEPERLGDAPEDIALPLLGDALTMIGHMEGRLSEYRALRERLQKVLEDMECVGPVPDEGATRGAERIRAWVCRGAPLDADGVAELHAAAEEIRAVANASEGMLRRGKDLALQVHAAFEAARGPRVWLLRDEEKAPLVERLRRRYQAWLPPEPAARLMLEWLGRDRLTIQEGTRTDGQPVILFNDGGAIPMSKLRWNEDLENFCPADTQPGATGLRYRGSDSQGHRAAGK